MTEETPSTGESVTPTPVTPAKGTPAPAGVTPQKPDTSLEDAMRRIAELEDSYKSLEHSNKNAIEERDRHRKKLSTYEKAEQEAKEAQLSEIERTQKQFAELKSQHDTYVAQMQARIVRYEVEKQANKLGIIDPEAAAKLMDWSELEYEDDGSPKNAHDLLKALIKNKSYLAPAKAEPAPETPAQPASPARPGTPAIPAMNPGRSFIAQPGSTAPGKIPSWSEVYTKR